MKSINETELQKRLDDRFPMHCESCHEDYNLGLSEMIELYNDDAPTITIDEYAIVCCEVWKYLELK